MAKKSKKGFRIPKEIGGIKVPKEARRAAEALVEKANSPAVRQALASGLAMAATAAAATMAAKQSRKTSDTAGTASDQPHAHADKSHCGASKPGQGGTNDPQQVADAIGQAANAFMSKMFGPR